MGVKKNYLSMYDNMEEMNGYKMSLIGDTTPSFTVKTTQGEINFPQDYSGKWEMGNTFFLSRRFYSGMYHGIHDCCQHDR